MKTLLLILFSIIVSGCVISEPTQKPEVESDKLNEMSDWDFFSVKSQLQFVANIKRDDGSIALTTFDTSTIERNPDDIGIIIDPHYKNCPLTPRHMEQVQKENNSTWGKVFYKPSDDPAPGENDVFCPPMDPATAAYAFCAQKGDRAVAICIQQVTDNPGLAEDIFKSFEWRE